jgi:thioester reductase-like protein
VAWNWIWREQVCCRAGKYLLTFSRYTRAHQTTLCQILAKASELGLQTTTFRIGQISGGGPVGAWSITDWVPLLTKSSLELGLPILPGVGFTIFFSSGEYSSYLSPQVVSWLPVNVVADSISEVALSSAKPKPALNLVHPAPVPWKIIMAALAEALRVAKLGDVALVPYETWLATLAQRAQNASEVDLQKIVS